MTQSATLFKQDDVESILGYTFKNKDFLKTAFTHSSYANETNGESNENMEFFGDAILGFIVSEYLFKNFPNRNEGYYSRVKSVVVSRNCLCEAVEKMCLEKYLIISNNQANSTQNAKVKLYANLYEAVLCALYLDGGVSVANRFVMDTLKKSLDEYMADGIQKDFKTMLQEYCHSEHCEPEYVEESCSGPAHNPSYVYVVKVKGKICGRGEGASTKQAQLVAAENALKLLLKHK